MKLSSLNVFLVSCTLVSLIAVPAFSQDTGNTPAAVQGTQTPAPEPITISQDKEIAIYGEVQTIDAQASTLDVQYYDYDSDSEKTANITINADTKLENAAAIGDIKKGDWVDVTYTSAEGKLTAKAVTVEKEEVPAPDEPPAQSSSPVSVPPEQ
jgi:biopolymer transport protein ExbD